MKRVLFHLTEEQYQRLGKLASRMGVSRSEALRYAIEVYAFVKNSYEEFDMGRERDAGEPTIVEVLD